MRCNFEFLMRTHRLATGSPTLARWPSLRLYVGRRVCLRGCTRVAGSHAFAGATTPIAPNRAQYGTENLSLRHAPEPIHQFNPRCLHPGDIDAHNAHQERIPYSQLPDLRASSRLTSMAHLAYLEMKVSTADFMLAITAAFAGAVRPFRRKPEIAPSVVAL
jgi:hypothetical protein